MTHTCEHGYPTRFSRTERPCPYDQPDGATLTDLHELDRFEITGKGTVICTENIANKTALRGRTVNIDGTPYRIRAFESCLIPGHDEAHCTCFGGSGLLVGSP